MSPLGPADVVGRMRPRMKCHLHASDMQLSRAYCPQFVNGDRDSGSFRAQARVTELALGFFLREQLVKFC